jgi:hypothetical protein
MLIAPPNNQLPAVDLMIAIAVTRLPQKLHVKMIPLRQQMCHQRLSNLHRQIRRQLLLLSLLQLLVALSQSPNQLSHHQHSLHLLIRHLHLSNQRFLRLHLHLNHRLS